MLKEVPGLTLMWLGIVGAAITLFANLLAPLDMADWAWWIVQNWQEGAPAFWDRLAAWLGLEVPSLLVPPLNIAAFLLVTAAGVRMRDHRRQGPAIVEFPLRHLIGASAIIAAMGYIIVAGPSQSSSGGGMPADAPLAIFLAAAATSFSPVLAGRGDLIKRLWFIMAGLIILLAVNELTKLALNIMASDAKN